MIIACSSDIGFPLLRNTFFSYFYRHLIMYLTLTLVLTVDILEEIILHLQRLNSAKLHEVFFIGKSE